MSRNEPTPMTTQQHLPPPEEQFWQRYSPHGEAPLSGAGSLTLHALIFGGLVLWFLYILPTFAGAKHNIQFEPVHLGAKVGGGGEKPAGVEAGPGVGAPREAAEVKGPAERVPQVVPEPPAPPEPPARPDIEFNKDKPRPIHLDNIHRLDEQADKITFPARGPGKGTGGPGRGGPGGPGPRTGQVKQSPRVERMNRWVLRFNTSSGADYVAQLRGLGAILAVPTQEVPDDPRYRLIRDLRPGAKLLDEDLSKINRIYWKDEKPESVREVMNYLGLRMTPSHFVAFMPVELEQKLFEMEARYLKRHHPRATEDDILITRFRVVRTRRGYVPELANMEMRR
jgi:hypothetical protein